MKNNQAGVWGHSPPDAERWAVYSFLHDFHGSFDVVLIAQIEQSYKACLHRLLFLNYSDASFVICHPLTLHYHFNEPGDEASSP